eukprot:TRINITY_DN102766_c0_g1_i1.p1 TRINITY_DN102766_c0_g1~~TRINITY_DN102766_c0_g1_i1.p1  ORF type:complete len:778 (-),score=118.62 TRINITY_DN102766_c0_g1_i1:54-2387(-)
MDREVSSSLAGDSAQDRSNAGLNSQDKSQFSAIQSRNGHSYSKNHVDMNWRGKGKYDTSPKGAFAKGKFGNSHSKGYHSKPSDDMGAWRSYEPDDNGVRSQPAKGGKAAAFMPEDVGWTAKGKYDGFSKGGSAKGKPAAGFSYKGGEPFGASPDQKKGSARHGEQHEACGKGKPSDFPADNRPSRLPDQFDAPSHAPLGDNFSGCHANFAKGGGCFSSSHSTDWPGKGGKHEPRYKGDYGKEFGKGKQADFMHDSSANSKGDSGKEFGKGKYNATLDTPGKGRQADFMQDPSANFKGDALTNFGRGKHNSALEVPGKGNQFDFMQNSAGDIYATKGKQGDSGFRGNYVSSTKGEDAQNVCKGSSNLPWNSKGGHGDYNPHAKGLGFHDNVSQVKGRGDGFIMNDKGKSHFGNDPGMLGKGAAADGSDFYFKGDNFQKGQSKSSNRGPPFHIPPRQMAHGGDGSLHSRDISNGKTNGFACGGCQGGKQDIFSRDLDRDPPNNAQPKGGNITFGELMELGRTLDATGSQPKPLSVPSVPIAPQLMSTRPLDNPPPAPVAPHPMQTRPQEMMTGTPWIPQSSSIWSQNGPGNTAPPEIAGLWETPKHTMPRPPSPAHSNASGIRTPSDDGFAMPRNGTAGCLASTPTPLAADFAWHAHQRLQELQESPYDAVHRAQQSAMVYQQMAPFSIEHFSDFIGAWVDLQGNSVTVFSADAWGGTSNLLVTLSKAPRPDVHLQIGPSEDGGWRCGNSYLDLQNSSAEQLSWVREDGLVSVWTRGRH